jgi:hypothetical protein
MQPIIVIGAFKSMEVRLPVWHVSSKILPDSGNGSLTSLLFYTYKAAECIDRETVLEIPRIVS